MVQDWLRRRPDIVDVRYVGDADAGPPNFLAEFHGAEVAIEVTRMLLNMGWPEDRRLGFQAELQWVVRCVMDDPKVPRLHGLSARWW